LIPFRTTTSVIIIIAVVASLGSFAYPTIAVPRQSTESNIGVGTNINTSSYLYPQTISTWSVTSYWYEGLAAVYNTACWPPPDRCSPETINAYVRTILAKSIQQVTTTTSTSRVTATNYFSLTSTSTHTYSQNIPLYAYLGFSDSQFAIVAMLIVAVLVLAIFYARKEFLRPTQMKMSQFIPTKLTCVKCGVDLPPKSEFCNKCGAKQP